MLVFLIILKKCDSRLKKYLNTLTLNKLRQLCRTLPSQIATCGTKEKVIDKIINKGYIYDDIIDHINKNKDKKFYIKCGGDCLKECNSCISHENYHFCSLSHIYYINNKISSDIDEKKSDRIVINKTSKKVCSYCNCITYMEEFENEFYE
jgi:hypothetical protein